MTRSGAFRVEKQSYSRGAWRVLWADTGTQVWQEERFDHPHIGTVTAPHPVCFDRKRDALAWIEAHLDAGLGSVSGGGHSDVGSRTSTGRSPGADLIAASFFPETYARAARIRALRASLTEDEWERAKDMARTSLLDIEQAINRVTAERSGSVSA